MPSSLDRLLRLPESMGRAWSLARRLAANRAELFSLELREEASFVAGLFLALALGLFCGAMCLLLATAAAIALLPPEHRLLGLAAAALVYGAAAALLIGLSLRKLRTRPKPFHESLELLKRETRCPGDD
ncbi:MAG: hypothetical protein PWQ57_973 [Desulfovibrionales bacterium]|jgi:uncharacterized membrane protein YqjE|nr:hypothetical protein [Desulfovibrionales bacterium]